MRKGCLYLKSHMRRPIRLGTEPYLGDIQRAILKDVNLTSSVAVILDKNKIYASIDEPLESIKAKVRSLRAECMPVLDHLAGAETAGGLQQGLQLFQCFIGGGLRLGKAIGVQAYQHRPLLSCVKI